MPTAQDACARCAAKLQGHALPETLVMRHNDICQKFQNHACHTALSSESGGSVRRHALPMGSQWLSLLLPPESMRFQKWSGLQPCGLLLKNSGARCSYSLEYARDVRDGSRNSPRRSTEMSTRCCANILPVSFSFSARDLTQPNLVETGPNRPTPVRPTSVRNCPKLDHVRPTGNGNWAISAKLFVYIGPCFHVWR